MMELYKDDLLDLLSARYGNATARDPLQLGSTEARGNEKTRDRTQALAQAKALQTAPLAPPAEPGHIGDHT